MPLSYDDAVALDHTIRDASQVYKDVSTTSVDSSLISVLEEKIDAALKKFKSNSAFIKLNTRSPKDTPFRQYEDPHFQSL